MDWWRVCAAGVVVRESVVSFSGMVEVVLVLVLVLGASVKVSSAERAVDWVGEARREGEMEVSGGGFVVGRGGRRGAVGGERRESQVWRSF